MPLPRACCATPSSSASVAAQRSFSPPTSWRLWRNSAPTSASSPAANWCITAPWRTCAAPVRWRKSSSPSSATTATRRTNSVGWRHEVNWSQLKTILWLRWRLTRNQWTRSQGLAAVLAATIAASALVLGGACFVGGLLAGIFGLAQAQPVVVWGVWLGVTLAFLLSWLIGLLQELQRSESIDLQRLMHLPVGLGQMFVINYLASHLAFSILVAVPAMMGLALGLAISRGPTMLLLTPLALGMVSMITAWTYCLRGWLAGLMSNPRRRRSVIMAIVLGFILLGQAPNLYFNVFRPSNPPTAAATSPPTQPRRNTPRPGGQAKLDQLRPLQKFIPPLWLPLGAQELAEGHALPALLGALGCFAIGALGPPSGYPD